MSKVKNENYIVIQGWMVNDLKLKGNELMVYAVIYGFSQTENQRFTGSLQYLADWTNSTKQGVIKNLKSLVEKGFIEKEEKKINNVKFCEYYATKFNRVVNNVDDGIKQSLMEGDKQSLIGGIKQSLPNNTIPLDNTNIDNIDNIKDIVDYLNYKAGTMFKYTSKATQTLIKARMHEGFTVGDFKTVIDKKVAEWLNDSKMAQYLRPQTLFGTKFESYLNQKVKPMTTKDLAQHMDFSDFHSDQPLKIDSLF